MEVEEPRHKLFSCGGSLAVLQTKAVLGSNPGAFTVQKPPEDRQSRGRANKIIQRDFFTIKIVSSIVFPPSLGTFRPPYLADFDLLYSFAP